MCRSIWFLSLLLAGCAGARTIEVPVQVPVPTLVRCGPAAVPASPDRPALATDLIKPDTPIDKLADYWKATALRLLAWSLSLEAERDSLREYERLCN
jgi:hypothetical protein